jgi:hypothetical protein
LIDNCVRARRPRPAAKRCAESRGYAHGRGAKRIDRVRVVADDGEPGPAWTQRQQDLGPEPVGVLVLVDENVIKASADFGGDGRLGHRVIPVQCPWQLRGPKPYCTGQERLMAQDGTSARFLPIGDHAGRLLRLQRDQTLAEQALQQERGAPARCEAGRYPQRHRAAPWQACDARQLWRDIVQDLVRPHPRAQGGDTGDT